LTVNQQSLTTLVSSLNGRALKPSDGEFDEARKVWNGMIDKRPAVIVRPANTDDVIAAVNFARSEGLAVSARGGGHHVAGGAVNDGGLVIDLSGMRDVSVNAASKTARAQGGAQLQDVDTATLAHGLAVPMGVFSETGIAGLTLAGGYGWQSRLRGLTCDNLVSAEIVTAKGELLKSSATENPDLFWALRGGGQNLGVVTSFEYRAHPMPDEVFFVFVTYPVEDVPQVLSGLRRYNETSPRESGALCVIWTFPPTEAYPEELWGKQFIGIVGPYIGPAADGERAMQPLRELATPLLDGSGPMPFAGVQRAFDEEYPKGRRYYWRSTYLKGLSDDAIATLHDLGTRRASPLTSLDVWVLGGAIGDVGPSESPIAHRQAPFMIGIEANWDDPADDAANIAWARECQTKLEPFSTGGSYLNFEDALDEQRVAAVYGANYQRLQEIKRKYDPHDLFGRRR
jgi:FAD/FMN-containing dehydrogenase